jgi:hypothetical protein
MTAALAGTRDNKIGAFGNETGAPFGGAYIAFALPAANPVCFLGYDRFDGFSRSTNIGLVILESPWITASNDWDEWVASWNVATPNDGHLKVEARAARGDTVTPYYNLGFWSPDPTKHKRESVRGQKDQFAEVKTDILACREKMERVQVRITLGGERALPTLKFLGLCFTDATAPPLSLPPNRAAWSKVIEVPRRSQLGWPDSDGWCSPTCVSMLLAHWGQTLKRPEMDLPVPAVAKAVNDPNWNGTGNWSFNTAFAGSFTGMRAFVTRFADVREIEDWLAAGVPVAVSVSFDLLNGKPQDEGNGHLVVVVGFTETGDVVVNDPWPNPKKENSVRKVYPRENLIRAWKRSRNAVYLIYPEGHHVPQNRWRHW